MYSKSEINNAVVRYLEHTGFNRLILKCALFDMDGVLFNSMPYHAKSWHQAMSEFGLNLSETEAFMHEGRTGEGTINIVMQRERNRNAAKDEIARIYSRKSEIFNSFSLPEPMKGAFDLVNQMVSDGISATIVTGSGQKSLLDRIESNYPKLFHLDKMVTAFDVKHGKPNPEPYLMGLKKMEVQPYEALVVENAPLGVEAGHAAKIFTIAVNTGPIDKQMLVDSGADLTFNSMIDFYETWPLLVEAIKMHS